MYLLNSQDEYNLITVCSSLDKTFLWGSTFHSFGKPSQMVATTTNDPPISPHCPVPCTNLYPNLFRWLSFFFNNQDRFGELYLSFPSLEGHELNMPEVNLICEEKGLSHNFKIYFGNWQTFLMRSYAVSLNFFHFVFSI